MKRGLLSYGYIENNGIQLFELTKANGLEGIVAKRKGSRYWFGKRSKDWIKCKVLNSEDYVLCGYILKDKNMTSFILGLYDSSGHLHYKGHVTLGASLRKLNSYIYAITSTPPFNYTPPGNEDAVWLVPKLVCVVETMPSERSDFRQPVCKAIRDDKLAKECIIKKPQA